MKAIVFNIQKLSTEDGPGLRTTIFFKGCPLKCQWCHNPEGINLKPETYRNLKKCIGCQTCQDAPEESREEVCPTGAYKVVGKKYSVDELLSAVISDRDFFRHSKGGITLSGGECLMQHSFLKVFMPLLREEGIHTALDTSGFAAPNIFRDIAALADLILYDLKIMSDADHQRYTGQPNRLILENAKILGTMPQPVWIRIPIIPGITNDIKNIEAIAEFIAEYIPNAERIDLLGYNDLCSADYEKMGLTFMLSGIPRVSEVEMMNLKQILAISGVDNITCSNYERG